MNFNPHDYQDYAIRYIEKHPVAAVLLDMGLPSAFLVSRFLWLRLCTSWCFLLVVVFPFGMYIYHSKRL